jgi:hypothetical protein
MMRRSQRRRRVSGVEVVVGVVGVGVPGVVGEGDEGEVEELLGAYKREGEGFFNEWQMGWRLLGIGNWVIFECRITFQLLSPFASSLL